MLCKCCTRYASPSGKLRSGHSTWEGQFSFQSQRWTMPKNVQTNIQLCSFHIRKIMLKILQTRFQQNMNREFPDVQAGFRKGRGTRDQTANIFWFIEKAREFQKNNHFCFINELIHQLNYSKDFDCVDYNKLENPSKDRNTRPPYLLPEKPVCRSRCNS